MKIHTDKKTKSSMEPNQNIYQPKSKYISVDIQ